MTASANARPSRNAESSRATLSIGQVLSQLRPEFPEITHSKVRYLEDRALLHPTRTASGYRKYTVDDVEQLFWILRTQRDSYLPLDVIKERLDSGEAFASQPQQKASGRQKHERSEVEKSAVSDAQRWAPEELAAEAAVSLNTIKTLTTAGLLVPDATGRFDVTALRIVNLAQELGDFGIEARHLRPVAGGADRSVDLVGRIVEPLLKKSGAAARSQAQTQAQEIGQLLIDLHTSLVRAGITRL